MLEFYKRCWHVFLPLSVLLGLGILQAIYYLNGDSRQRIVIIILLTLAIICLVIGLIGCINALKYARKEKREIKAVKNRKVLKESFKRVHPEWSDEQLEIATSDRPPAPPIEGEEEWVSPREAYKKSRQKKK